MKNIGFLALAASALAMPAYSQRSPMPRIQPGPIENYNRAAIRKQAEADRKAKHAAKLARREAQRQKGKKS